MKIATLVDSRAPREKGVDEPGIGFMPTSVVMISCREQGGKGEHHPHPRLVIRLPLASEDHDRNLRRGTYTPS